MTSHFDAHSHNSQSQITVTTHNDIPSWHVIYCCLLDQMEQVLFCSMIQFILYTNQIFDEQHCPMNHECPLISICGQWPGMLPNKKMVLTFADMVKHVHHRDYYQRTALHHAVMQGKQNWVEQLLRYGADPLVVCESLQSPLHQAAMHRYQKIVEILVDACPIAKRSHFINMRDGTGKTALHYAVSSCSLAAIKILMENGADITMCDDIDHNTPLTLAEDLDRCRLEEMEDEDDDGKPTSIVDFLKRLMDAPLSH